MNLRIFTLSSIITAGLVTASYADLIGHWAFDEGTGVTTADSSGLGNDATITSAIWGTDEVRDSYLVFNGTDSLVDPAITLPVMTDLNDFTWAVWANSQEAIGATQQNAIIIGNRWDATGAEFTPRQFVKITPTKFEWHQEGVGTDNLDVPDLRVNEWHHLAVVKTGTTLEYFFDGVSIGSKELTQVIGTAEHPFFVGGIANRTAVNEHFNGFIDDVRIYDEALSQADIQDLIGDGNLPPIFTESPLSAADATVGTPYTGTIGDKVTDSNPGDTLTITKVDGPDWLTIGTDGILSGEVTVAEAGLNRFTVQVSDGLAETRTTLNIIVVDPNATPAPDNFFGHWPLDDGAGDVAADISGNKFDAIITNVDTGGLGLDGSAWVEDVDFGTVLSFNGQNESGAFATVGAPPAFGALPLMDLENDFTWSLWAKSDQVVNNDIILGNRYAPNGSEYVPREFIKFTSNQLEFHTSGAPQNIDYDDLVIGEWNHHVAIKDGANLSYYRNGALINTIVLTEAPLNQLPVYFGGFGNENWQGYLSDVRLWERALSAGETLALYHEKIPAPSEFIEITEFIVGANNDVSLTFKSTAETTYIVESKTDLNEGTWDEIDDSVLASGDTTTVVLPGAQFPNASTTDKLFFRVRKSLAP